MVRCLVAALTLLTALGASAQMPPPPTKLSSVMPPDAPANPPFSFGAIAAFQRKLDIFAWQEFIAMNWPAARPGIPSQKSIGGNVTGAPCGRPTFLLRKSFSRVRRRHHRGAHPSQFRRSVPKLLQHLPVSR